MDQYQQRNTRNIIHFLRDRESCSTGRFHHLKYSQLNPFSYNQGFYKSITPNFTVQNVETALLYIRKFSPDGKFLVSFCNDQKGIIVCKYRGIGSVAGLLKDEHRECIKTTDQDAKSKEIRGKIFDLLFQTLFTVRISSINYGRYQLHREFSIFMEDGRYVILAGMAVSERRIPVATYWVYPDIFDNMEMFAYAFFVVDLHKGVISDVLCFQNDNIILSHHHGVSVYGKTIAILSRVRQCISLFDLVNGKLVSATIVGPYNERSPLLDKGITLDVVPPLTRIKQRIFTYMYQDIMKSEVLEVRRRRLNLFHKEYPILEKMIMEKAQLLDDDTFLIRYEERPDHIPSPHCVSFNKNIFNYYVFFSMAEDKVLKICHKDSIQLLYILRNFCDKFRNVRSLHSNLGSPSPSTNIYVRELFDKAVNEQNCVKEAARSYNPTLPASTQNYCISQYLNCNLFAYDERLISALERPKLAKSGSICFTDRLTGLTSFRFHSQEPSETSSTKELVAFIFHPYEPFVLAIQRLSSRYSFNFHIYNFSTDVQK